MRNIRVTVSQNPVLGLTFRESCAEHQHNVATAMNEILCAIGASSWANAVAESFFHLLKLERIRLRTYQTRKQERQDVSDYFEMFYNQQRKHVRNEML